MRVDIVVYSGNLYYNSCSVEDRKGREGYARVFNRR